MGYGKVFQVLLVIGGLFSAASGTMVVGARESEPPIPLAVRGQVLDTGGGPLPGARVALIPAGDLYAAALARSAGRALPEPTATVETGSWGEFVLEAPEPGLWTVRVTAPGRVPMAHEAVPVVRDVLLAPVTLPPDVGLAVRTAPAGVAVRLRTPTEATHDAEPSWRPAQRLGHSDAEGRLLLPRAAGETLELVASRVGWQGLRRPLEPRAGVAEITLEASEPCRFEVGLHDGGSTAGVLILHDDVVVGIVDASGSVELPTLTTPLDFLTLDGVRWRLPVTCGPAARTVLPEPHEIQGRVVDKTTNLPVVGALVWDDLGRAVTTDARGVFRLTTTGLAARQLFADAAGHQAAGLAVAAASEAEAVLRLPPEPTISGWVVDADGRPVVGAEVMMERAWRTGRQWQVTGQSMGAGVSWYDGSFLLRLPRLARSGLSVQVRHEAFAPHQEYRDRLPEGPVEITLYPGSRVYGEVVDPQDAPVSDALVALTFSRSGVDGRVQPEPDFAVTTALDGTFSLLHVPSGRFDIVIERAGFAATELPALEVPPEAPEIDLGIVVLEPGMVVEGVVRDEAGTPVGGARIQAGVASYTAFLIPDSRRPGGPTRPETDDQGRFTLRDLRRGEILTLGVDHPDYVPATVPGVEVPTEAPLEITLVAGAGIAGRVVDEAGAPIAGANILASRDVKTGVGALVPWALRQQNQSTAEDGTFALRKLAAGSWRLEAQREGYLSARAAMELTAGAEAGPLEMVLRRGATLHGRVIGPRGEVAAEAQVLYRSVEGNYSRSTGTTTDGDGRFQFSGLKTGPLQLEATHEALGKVSRWVEIQSGDNRAELRLVAKPSLAGRVVDAAGAPVPSAEVIVRHAGGTQFTSVTPVGEFRFANLEPGEYTVSARGEGFAASQAVVVTLADTSREGVELRLRRGVVLSGTLHGLTLAQLSQTSVTAYETGGGGFQNLAEPADLDARYRLEGLSPGRWQVVARVEGGPTERESLTVEEGAGDLQLDFQFAGNSAFRVQLLHNGEPLSQVLVSLYGKGTSASATTNTVGEARIDGLEDGTYHLSIGLPWAQVSREVEVWDGGEALVEIDSGRLVGSVHSATDGAPLDGVSLTANALGTDAPSGGRADRRNIEFASGVGGDFEQPLPPGRYRLVATREGYAAEQWEVEVTAGGVTALALELRPGGSLEVTFRHANGAVPSQVVLYALDGDGRLLLQRSLQPRGPEGRFPLPSLPAGSRVVLYADGAAFFEVAAAQFQEGATVTLPPGSTLQVQTPTDSSGSDGTGQLHLTAPDGSPFAPALFGMLIDHWPLNGGSARVPGLTAGAWSYRLTLADGRSWEGTFTAFPGRAVTLNLQ